MTEDFEKKLEFSKLTLEMIQELEKTLHISDSIFVRYYQLKNNGEQNQLINIAKQ